LNLNRAQHYIFADKSYSQVTAWQGKWIEGWIKHQWICHKTYMLI